MKVQGGYLYQGQSYFGAQSGPPPQIIRPGMVQAYYVSPEMNYFRTSHTAPYASNKPAFSIMISKKKNANGSYNAEAKDHSFGAEDTMSLLCDQSL